MSWAPLYNLSFTKAPGAQEPVSLDDIKGSIKGLEDVADFDAELLKKRVAAREKLEKLCGGLSFINGHVAAYCPITSTDQTVQQIPYAYSPSVISNLVINGVENGEADDLMTLNTDYYFVGGEIIFASTGKYRIEYDIVIAELPEAIKQAILLEIESLWEKAKEASNELHEQARGLINGYRHVWQ